jgi:SAM-dependent methyltransferase
MPESGVLDRPSCCLRGDETRMRPVTEGHDFTGEYWEHHYREPDPHSHPSAPNQHLLALTENLQPGTALDAGCGEGVDALRLAQLGWRVTGVDISATAVARARAAADAAGLAAELEFECVDLTAWEPGSHAFDLVSARHVHTTDDRAFVRALGAAVRPGGWLLVVGHEPPGDEDVDLHSPGSHATADQVKAHLDGAAWDCTVAEARISIATTPEGDRVEDKDSVFLARKRTTTG